MLNPSIPFSPKMQALLTDLSPHVVVVGSVARGKLDPKDLDLIYAETDPLAETGQAEVRVGAIIQQHGIPFESFWPGNWCFCDEPIPGLIQQIEILPFHQGKSYKRCRRRGRKQIICGVELVVARASYARPLIP